MQQAEIQSHDVPVQSESFRKKLVAKFQFIMALLVLVDIGLDGFQTYIYFNYSQQPKEETHSLSDQEEMLSAYLIMVSITWVTPPVLAALYLYMCKEKCAPRGCPDCLPNSEKILTFCDKNCVDNREWVRTIYHSNGRIERRIENNDTCNFICMSIGFALAFALSLSFGFITCSLYIYLVVPFAALVIYAKASCGKSYKENEKIFGSLVKVGDIAKLRLFHHILEAVPQLTINIMFTMSNSSFLKDNGYYNISWTCLVTSGIFSFYGILTMICAFMC